MHIHKAKPLHGLREFMAEIGIIVVGVLIALGLEQAVESLHWNRKVALAEVRLRADLKDDSSYAAQYDILKPCAEAYLDRMQRDLLQHDAADMIQLYGFGPPFESFPWRVVAWESAVASQIGDHMDNSRFQAYAEEFRGANLLREFQLRYRDDYAAAMVGRFALPPDTKTLSDQLAAVERLRAYIRIGRLISADEFIIPGSAHVAFTPDPAIVEELRQRAAKCLAVLGQSQK